MPALLSSKRCPPPIHHGSFLLDGDCCVRGRRNKLSSDLELKKENERGGRRFSGCAGDTLHDVQQYRHRRGFHSLVGCRYGIPRVLVVFPPAVCPGELDASAATVFFFRVEVPWMTTAGTAVAAGSTNACFVGLEVACRVVEINELPRTSAGGVGWPAVVPHASGWMMRGEQELQVLGRLLRVRGGAFGRALGLGAGGGGGLKRFGLGPWCQRTPSAG